MKFTIAAVSCMIEESTGNIILDPNSIQLQVCMERVCVHVPQANINFFCSGCEG